MGELNEINVNKNDGLRDVKPGHDRVKEYHMHSYWFQNNIKQEEEALRLRDAIVEEVKAGNMMLYAMGLQATSFLDSTTPRSPTSTLNRLVLILLVALKFGFPSSFFHT